MPPIDLPLWNDDWILARRAPRHDADPHRAHAAFVEPERTRHDTVEDVLTILLTNRECPFRCLMCDLWKNTTEERVPLGAIPTQIEAALATQPAAQHVKLYNAGNFFDAQAIPPADHARIAELMAPFASVIIECHPLLVGPRCVAFAERLLPVGERRGVSPPCLPACGFASYSSPLAVSPPKTTGGETASGEDTAGLRRTARRPELQVAMGLETIHPDILPRLNKRMTLSDFERAARFLADHAIPVRAFILLRPPLLSEAEGLDWAKRSIDWAQDVGVECCVIIPTRAGNGAMDELQRQGLFAPPSLASLEQALEHGIHQRRGRVFADLWDIEKTFRCPRCGPMRAERLRTMNLTQTLPPLIECECGT